MGYRNKAQRNFINVLDYGLDGKSTSLISQATLNKIFAAAVAHKRPVYFPSGTYVFPSNFTYNFGLNDVTIIGESRENTIITSRWGSNVMQIVERVDITLPRAVGDGFYRIDKIGVNHADWSALNTPDIDDYIKVVSGVVSFATLSEIKAANLVTELDVTQADPGIDGTYVVATMDSTMGGGGYTHSNLPYNTSVKVLIGTVLKRTGGVWSRLAPSKGFEFGGNFDIEGIYFHDCSFNLFTPNNTTTPNFELYRIRKNKFRHVIRINSLDRQFETSGIQSQGFFKGLNYHLSDGERFNYRNIEFVDNDCSYIHTCIFWEMPPTRRLYVDNNNIHNCYTYTEMFIYLPMSSFVITDQDDDEGYTNKTDITYSNNVFRNVRHYSPVSVAGHHLLRGNGQAVYKNNRVYDSTGTVFYITGNNNLVEGNTVVPFVQSFPTKESLAWGISSIFHLKTGNQNQISTTIISNCKVEKSGLSRPLDLKGSDTNLIINTCRLQSLGWAEQLLPNEGELNKEMLYLVEDVSRLIELLGTVPDWAAADYPSGKYVMFSTTLYVSVAKVSSADGDPTVATTKWRAIGADSYIYWDIRRNAWMHWPANVNRQIPIFSKNYDNRCLRPIKIINSVLSGYSLVEATDGTIEELEVSNCTVFAERDLLIQSVGSNAVTGGNGAYIGTLTLTKNKIYRGWNSVSTRYFNSIKNLITSDNQFYYAALQFNIDFRHECQWINNHVKVWEKYNDTEVVNLLGLPLSSTPVVFRKVLPAAWADGEYTIGKYVSYNGQSYEAIDSVVAGDGNPATATTKWKLVDNPSLIIRGGSIDSYLSRTACLSWSNINNVTLDNIILRCRLVKDWVSLYNTNRFAISLLGPSATTKDLQIRDIKFEFDNKANRTLFHVGQAGNVQTIENLYVKGIGADPLPLTKIYYTDGNGSMVINKLLSPSSEIKDTAFEALITNKDFGTQRVKAIEITNEIKAPYLASGTTKFLTIDTTGVVGATTTAPGASGGGGGDLSSNTSSSVDNELALFSGTTGKVIKRSSGSGFAKILNGVISYLTKLNISDDTEGNLPVNRIAASGGGSTDFLRKDGTWAAPPSGGGGGGGTSLVSSADFVGSGVTGDPWRLAFNNAIQDPGSSGMLARVSANTVIPRQFLGTSGYVKWTNANGVSGNPTVDLDTIAKGVIDGTQRVKEAIAVVSTQTYTVGANDVNLVNNYTSGDSTWTLQALGTTTDKNKLWIQNMTANTINLNVTVYEGATGVTTIPPMTNAKLVYCNTTGVNKIFIFKM